MLTAQEMREQCFQDRNTVSGSGHGASLVPSILSLGVLGGE
jgi:hypothetical protein